MGSIISAFFTLLLIIISVFLIFLILLQRANTAAGLGTAFGGGLAESTFGAEAGGLLKKWTMGATVAFFLISLGLYLGYISGAGGPQVEEGSLPVSISDTATAPETPLPIENSGDELSIPTLLQSPDLEAIEGAAATADANADTVEQEGEQEGESDADTPEQP